MSRPRGDPLSVLVIDGEPAILTFLARMLDANGIRALLARSAGEAITLVKRRYVPIDLVLTNVLLPDHSDVPELIDGLRELRPGIRALYMSAWLDQEVLDAEVIRIELIDRGLRHMSKSSNDRGLLEAIRNAAAKRPRRSAAKPPRLARGMGRQ